MPYVPTAYERGLAVAAATLARGCPGAPGLARRRSAELGRWVDELLSDGHLLASERRACELRREALAGTVHPTRLDPPTTSSSPPAQRYLERRALASLWPRPAGVFEGPIAALDAPSLTEVERLLLELGRRRLVTAFSGAPRAHLARLCAELGEPEASRIIALSRALSPSPGEIRRAQRAVARLSIEAGAGLSGQGRSLLLEAAASWVGPVLAGLHPDAPRWLAQRLAAPEGGLLLRASSLPATEEDRLQLLDTLARL